ncbi:MAG TPA: tetratricopeptide repeat protein [Candidatus Binatia bacterium]|nr:tetratricopeptide repeat protein [Candidatus Binatia bacterium]
MSKLRIVRITAIVVALSTAGLVFRQHVAKADGAKPLKADEIFGLIVGNALPQNIVHAISQDGLAFRPDDQYRAELTTLGADASITSALNAATIASQAQPIDAAQRDVLQHYVTAAQKIKSKNYDAAASEMAAVARSTIDDAGPAFVMGEVFRLQERFLESANVYEGVLKIDPEFPEADAKLAFISYKLDDGDSAFKQATAALALYPDDAEAYKNAALGLSLLKKFDAAENDYQKALLIKPNYPVGLFDLANLYETEGKYKLAISEYKKAEIANPNDADVVYNLAIAYDYDGDVASAIRTYRQAIQMEPGMIAAHINLAGDLNHSGMYKEAVTEYRTVEQLEPDSAVCHDCLGTALFRTWDFEGAEKEYRTAMALDPTDAVAHVGIGGIRENQKKYVEALAEYETAEQLNPESMDALKGIARVDLLQKNFAGAVTAMKQAEEERPSDANIHDLYGQALAGEGNKADAIQEFKQSVLLDPKQDQVALRLAAALEADGQWAAALQQYRSTAAAEASLDRRHTSWLATNLDPQTEYKAAQKRFDGHVAALRAAGKSNEAASLEASVTASTKNLDLSEKLNELMLAGQNAARERKVAETVKDFDDAVNVAEQLQPRDPRLVVALDYLGQANLGTNFPAADEAFERELKTVDEMFGPQSPKLEGPLQSLGESALLQKKYAVAEKFFFNAVDVDAKTYGESSDRVASALVIATRVYWAQQQYDKVETYLLRAERLDESIYGPDSPNIMVTLWTLCSLYDKWNKPEKAEPCYAHALAITEKQFGDNSPQIAPLLTTDAAELRKLGKNEEADKLERRAAELQSATMAPPPQR